jgi:hypothetical protein
MSHFDNIYDSRLHHLLYGFGIKVLYVFLGSPMGAAVLSISSWCNYTNSNNLAKLWNSCFYKFLKSFTPSLCCFLWAKNQENLQNRFLTYFYFLKDESRLWDHHAMCVWQRDCPHLSTFESQNLVWTFCHWRPSHPHAFRFPTVGNTNTGKYLPCGQVDIATSKSISAMNSM